MAALLAGAAVGLAWAGATDASAQSTGRWWPSNEVQHLHLRFGPLAIAPGQNNIKST